MEWFSLGTAVLCVFLFLYTCLRHQQVTGGSTAEQKGVTRRKRVCIVGTGAAGMAAVWSLSRFPDRFQVEAWDRMPVPGGVATSEPVNEDDHAGDGGRTNAKAWINDGVQAAAPTYRNALLMMSEFGFRGSPFHITISFGKGDNHWTNYQTKPPAKLVRRLQPEIARFGRVLRWIHRLEPLFVFIPIRLVLRVLGFSDEFRNRMVFPLVAVFFGTGNQTPNVSAAIIARVFLDDDLRLFEYDSETLLSQKPQMYAFPSLGQIYRTMEQQITAQSTADGEPSVKFRHNCTVAHVKRHPDKVIVTDSDGHSAEFDEIIFACDAEQALKMISNPTRMEKFALGNVEFFNDVTVTHEDIDYMRKHYELNLDTDGDQYFTRTDERDPEKIEMSFNLCQYQPQLSGRDKKTGNIFQTIFLDDKCSSMWTIDEIDASKVLLRKWWRQFAHTWRHYAFTVPWMRFLQGRNRSWFCGSYTLVNTHEIAVVSGLAAAHRVGAAYPFFDRDPLAAKQFRTYMSLSHGVSV